MLIRPSNKDTGLARTLDQVPTKPRSTALAAHSAVLGVQDLSADFQVSSPDGTSLPYSDERSVSCWTCPKSIFDVKFNSPPRQHTSLLLGISQATESCRW